MGPLTEIMINGANNQCQLIVPKLCSKQSIEDHKSKTLGFP